jgi:hypothetical protein
MTNHAHRANHKHKPFHERRHDNRVAQAFARMRYRYGRPHSSQVEQLCARFDALCPQAQEVVNEIARRCTVAQTDNALLELLQTVPEEGILALKGLEKEWAEQSTAALELCHAVQFCEATPNCSPMLGPILKFALTQPKALGWLEKLGMMQEWVEAYRFSPEGAEIILEAAQQANGYDPLYELVERVTQLPDSEVKRPVHWFEIAALQPDDLRLLLKKTPPQMMQNIPYDTNYGDYEDDTEALVHPEKSRSYRQPTALGERVIRQMRTIRTEQREWMMEITKDALKPYVPFEEHQILVYQRMDTLAPTTRDVLQLRSFIHKTLWHANMGQEMCTPPAQGEIHIAQPDSSRLKGLVSLLEEVPPQEMPEFYKPADQIGLIERLSVIGQFLLDHPAYDGQERNAYLNWQQLFHKHLQTQKAQPDGLAHRILANDLKPEHLEYLRMFQPEKYQTLYKAQQHLCEQHHGKTAINEAQSALHILWEVLEKEWNKLKKRQWNLSDSRATTTKPNQGQLNELLLLPQESLKEGLSLLTKRSNSAADQKVLERLAKEHAELRYEMGEFIGR